MKQYFGRMKTKEKCPPRKPLKKVVWSWIGAFLGIYCIALISQFYGLEKTHNIFLIGSFGASAVLVYGAPLAEFSQPRNLIGGHVFSAIVGVTTFILIGESFIWATSVAVSLAIVVMHLTRTLHPPGGATALIAVIGGERIHSMGYSYIFSPVLVGAVIMLLIALLVNNISTNPKRHYPVYWI